MKRGENELEDDFLSPTPRYFATEQNFYAHITCLFGSNCDSIQKFSFLFFFPFFFLSSTNLHIFYDKLIEIFFVINYVSFAISTWFLNNVKYDTAVLKICKTYIYRKTIMTCSHQTNECLVSD